MGRTLVAGVLGLLLPVAGMDGSNPRRLFAVEATTPSQTPAGIETLPPAVQVLVLHNDSTLVGRIERLEGSYRVRTDFGDTMVPAKSVARVCDSLEEGYQYLRSRANLRDGQERLRLARWCLKQGLLEEARSEAVEAARLLPRSAEARGLVRVVEKMLEESRTGPGKAPVASDSWASDNRDRKQPVRQPPTAADQPQTAALALDAQSLQVFTQKIQPILSNTCSAASCHGGEKGGSFRFTKVSGGYTAQLTRDNLHRTLPWVAANDPLNSPLLRKSLEAHGGAGKPPLASRDAPAYQTLEAWVAALVPVPSGLAAERLPEFEAGDREPAGISGRASPNGFAALPAPTASALHATPPPAHTLTPKDADSQSPMMPSLPTALTLPTAATPSAGGNGVTTPIVLNPLKPGQPVPKPAKNVLGGGTTVAQAGVSGNASAAEPQRGGKSPSLPVGPALPAPADPFDPAVFNQQMHPERKSR